jgi:predicted MPP superfamily phosphohydrolase
MAGRDLSLYSILLAHRPEHIDQYLNYGFDLVLSGHSHGGQWRIPFILNGLYAPDQGFFPKYAGGKYEHGSTIHIVGRGLSKNSTRIPRIFNPPELVIIELY